MIELIYEAAFIPEHWNLVLQKVSELSRAASAQVFFFSESAAPRGMTMENARLLFDKFIAGDMWKFSDGTQKMYDMQPASFVRVDDFITPEQSAHDPARVLLREFGLGAMVCRHRHADRRARDLRGREMDQGRRFRAGRDRPPRRAAAHISPAPVWSPGDCGSNAPKPPPPRSN